MVRVRVVPAGLRSWVQVGGAVLWRKKCVPLPDTYPLSVCSLSVVSWSVYCLSITCLSPVCCLSSPFPCLAAVVLTCQHQACLPVSTLPTMMVMDLSEIVNNPQLNALFYKLRWLLYLFTAIERQLKQWWHTMSLVSSTFGQHQNHPWNILKMSVLYSAQHRISSVNYSLNLIVLES